MEDSQYIKSLFLKFWADQCTSEEIEVIINYLKTADHGEDLPGIEEMKARFGLLPQMDEQRADDIFNEIVGDTTSPIASPRPRGLPWWVGRAAAAFVGCLLLVGVYLWYADHNNTVRYATHFGETRSITLPDGTSVIMNANSELRTLADWPEDSIREVWLEGEAYFSVKHTQNHQKFIVNTSHELRIEVLGTQFNVNSREEKATVVLNSGKVKVQALTSQKESQWVMKPGELVEYKPKNQRVDQKKVDTTLYTSWRKNLLLFKDTSLEEIARLVSDNYGYEVEFGEDSLAYLQFTGSVPADQPELLLTTLAKSFGLDITQKGKQITIAR